MKAIYPYPAASLLCRFPVFFRVFSNPGSRFFQIVEICGLQFPLVERQSLYGFFSTLFGGDIPFNKFRDKSIRGHSLLQSLLRNFLLEFRGEVNKQFSQVRNIFQILKRLIIPALLHEILNNILFCQGNRFSSRQPSINCFFGRMSFFSKPKAIFVGCF
nr:MAG TPA: hypothetical protein [Bacteriophage sp.]